MEMTKGVREGGVISLNARLSLQTVQCTDWSEVLDEH